MRKPKKETRPESPKVSPASQAAASIPKPVGRPKGWRPVEHGQDPGGRPVEWTEERIDALADSLIAWSQLHTACYLETFCAENETYPQKLSELASKSDKFSEALKRAKACCAAHLSEATAGGEMPPAFGIFALKQHGWSDRQQVEHTGKVEQAHSGAIAVTIDTKTLSDLLNGRSPQ